MLRRTCRSALLCLQRKQPWQHGMLQYGLLHVDIHTNKEARSTLKYHTHNDLLATSLTKPLTLPSTIPATQNLKHPQS